METMVLGDPNLLESCSITPRLELQQRIGADVIYTDSTAIWQNRDAIDGNTVTASPIEIVVSGVDDNAARRRPAIMVPN